MKPQRREDSFEKVAIGEFLEGEIVDIEYDQEHKSTFQGQEKIAPAIRIIFELNGYKYPHRTNWMTFSYGDRTNLYNKFLTKLVEGAHPDMNFDLDCIKHMKVKTLWAEKNNFQYIESIFPLGAKVTLDSPPPTEEVDLGEQPSEEDYNEAV